MINKAQRELNIREILRYLWQHIAVIVVCILIFGAIGAGNAKNKNKNIVTLYNAECLLFFDADSGERGNMAELADHMAYYMDLAKLGNVVATSESVLKSVNNVLPRPITQDEMQAIVKVETVDSSSFLRLCVQNEKEQTATEICNAVIEAMPDACVKMTRLGQFRKVSDVQTHTVTEAPTSVKKAAIVGALLGLILATLILLGVELFDHSLHDATDIIYYLGTPILGVLPAAEKKYDHAGQESIRNLRTSILARQETGTVLFIGADDKSNVMKTGVLLAESLEQVGKEVLLVNVNMCQSKGKNNFSNLPCDESSSGKLVRTENGVSMMSVDTSADADADFWDSGSATKKIDALKQNYDIVIFVAPPVVQHADTAELSRHVQGVVLSVETAKTTIESAVQTKQRLEDLHATILGATLVDYRYDKALRHDGYYYALSNKGR